MGNQLQCPNCGGYKVRKQGQPEATLLAFVWPILALFTLVPGICLLVSGVSLLIEGNSTSLYVLIPAFPLILVAIVPLMYGIKIRRSTKVECIICGYQWDFGDQSG